MERLKTKRWENKLISVAILVAFNIDLKKIYFFISFLLKKILIEKEDSCVKNNLLRRSVINNHNLFAPKGISLENMK